ncbi:MAG: flippase [Cyanobacteria bacterium QS_7_48_42]|jgi:O-antigen/teichoic acid export membrane protein|nr:MAG: flippase [Cyanobacteria bacterium QH_1_48_107]PSO56216.1 MAG: flippase [Cyanobacteria bacterium QH_10_48_56]PSO64202.1 MAG: flippase [Cyanobacteria bacterium QH_6_48_35]PSO93118.1 MAG: flippase [Cyanobacteria bacterium QS_6_48_18]PSO93359.1 MAG: flippase [Cyanobacteria bacterium SW_6_48_11]PSO98603.1 MAG: flippase [Cyanobacteria bacterium SW_12_48_29]PSP00810.1 MAG: flippase [Cyanobacteria bacterium QS_7_48_42]PSP03396.1 MAG: flippase [Cyanobacteria bacterium SW_7_48_12]PSP14371.1 M
MLTKLTKVSQRLSPGLRRIIQSVGWLSGERVLRMAVTLFVGIYVVRYLGPQAYGKLSYAASFVGLFEAITKLGLDGIVVRNVVQDENSTQEILGTAFGLRLMSSLGIFALIVGTSWSVAEEPQVRWMMVIIATGLVLQSTQVIGLWFQSEVLSGPIARVRIIAFFATAGAKLLFIALGLPLIFFAWAMLLEILLKAVGMMGMYFHHGQSMAHWKMKWGKARGLLKDSWPLILSGVMVTIYMKIDQVMLGNLASNEAVGNYAAAVRLTEVWYFIPTAICSSVFPAIMRAKQRSEEEYYQRWQQLYDIMAWVSIVIAVGMTFLAGTLITTLLGAQYAEAATILALYIWATPFVFLGVARGKWFVAENLTKFSFITTSLGAVVNVVLNLVLIPSYQGMGAALATVISQAVSAYIIFLVYPPFWRIGWMLIKALFIPLRIGQNLTYIGYLKNLLKPT